jgi:SPP1 gp7 family putative phage head morphogenesis protein
MKREITADTPTQIQSPKSPRAQENELGDFIELMVAQMAQRYRNQVLDQLSVGTVEKFADAQTGNYAAILLRLSKKVKRKLLSQFDDSRIEAQIRKTLGKVDKKTRDAFYSRIAAKVGIDSKALIAKEGLKTTTNALILETAQWVKTLRDEALEKFTNNSLFAMSQGESIDTVVKQFDEIVSERKNHARFLARNQVQNYNSVTTKIRAQNLGIEKAVWVTAGDERVRPSHVARDGKEFDLAEGLYSSQDGLSLLPGSDYNCRCTYELIIPETA